MTDISVSALTAQRTAATPASTPVAEDKTQLDKEAFLRLLVTQLQNQDPSSPMDSSALMTQTTQLSSMESLEALKTTMADQYALQMRMAGASLVGREVSWEAPDGTTRTGLVSSVAYSVGSPVVKVGDETLGLDEVTAITAPSAGATPAA
ncbi:flagellar hook assembly protein FlgD [Cellulomonas endophytica]|uniref:flagellar hook assembly protein FlgD n=1 Tax=Cellulomonas endophytica TaxID=2494735 RepID=UPI001011E5BF|nr:flagellar hook capping FlgD N-terminal domain-containing protein [Cellulomonas endophytica]